MVSKISELSEREFLGNYDVNKYEHPSVTVDTLIFSVMDNDTSNYRKLPEKELKILLIRRKDHPYINQWALPGGFVEMDEDLDDAAYRELREETSVKDVYLEQLYTWGDVNRDPRTRVISCSYMALINGKNTVIRASSDARDVQWFSLRSKVIQENKTIFEKGYQLDKKISLELYCGDEKLSCDVLITKKKENEMISVTRKVLKSDGLAFDHSMIIYYGLERLRAKTEFTDIALYLMEQEFTLTELQNVYEVILDKTLLAANFRRKINMYVEETDNSTKDAGHRPARLYKHKQQKTYDFY